MTHNHEIHGNLARLLATENLNIEHKNIETAMFDVNSRTLTLPLWEYASDNIYQLLIGHESAHAIFTPNIDVKEKTKVPHPYINVVEDARIEKLMKRKYPGLKRIFYSAYIEFCEKDFFELGDRNPDELGFADKVNLYFKCSNYYKLNFTEEEKEIIDLIANTETFDDVIYASEVLYNYCKDDNIEKTVTVTIGGDQSSGGMSTQPNESGENPNLGNLQTSDGSSNQKNESQNNDSGNGVDKNLNDSNEQQNSPGQQNSQDIGGTGKSSGHGTIKTMESYQRSINKLTSQSQFPKADVTYVTIPEFYLDKIIVESKTLHSKLNSYWAARSDCDFTKVDFDYKKFKKSAQKEVNYLVKEFECKKAAESYSRTSEFKTGSLDSNLLYSYKYNEEIFKKVTTVMDGKNHGLIFLLDWSGSMSDIMLDTCKQLYNLVWFCKKVSIPFDVYAFTTSWGGIHTQYRKEKNAFGLHGKFNLLNIISSGVNSVMLDTQMKNIYRLASYFSCGGSYNYSYNFPYEFNLSGTPLNESLLCFHNIIPNFKKKTKVHKVHCITLTDGECSDLPVNKLNSIGNMSMFAISDECYLRDKKLKTTYRFPKHNYYSSNSHKFTEVIIRNLKDNFPDVNFIGIRLLESYSHTSFISKYSKTNKESEYHLNEWKKNKSCSIKTDGYQTYFGLSTSALSEDSTFAVRPGSTNAEIKNAFKKVFSAKKTNKKILSDFIDLIA